MASYKQRLVEQTISKDDITSLANWLIDEPILTKNEVTGQFERRWAEWNGNQYAVFVNSGSSANLLMIYGLVVSGALKNRKVVVPAVSWVTTVSPVMQLGLEPILCDCDPLNLGLSVDHLNEICKEHDPAAVIAVHVLGHACHLNEISEICRKQGAILLEDCCESHGTLYDGQKVGTFGRCATFSFYYAHHMSTIEGGMVVTDDESLYNIFLSLRSHGWSRDLDTEYRTRLRKEYALSEFRERFAFYYPGFNLRSTDVNAFLGLRQLDRLTATVECRYQNYCHYEKRLDGRFAIQRSDGRPAILALGLLIEDCEHVAMNLEENGIETRPLICGSVGEQPFWIREYGRQMLKNASRVNRDGIYLPAHQHLTSSDIDEICDCLIRYA